MYVWLASLLFYSYVFLICAVLRRRALQSDLRKETRTVLLEVLRTVQICTPLFDVDVILNNYGLLGVFIEISVLTLADMQIPSHEEPCCGNPCLLYKLLREQPDSELLALLILLAQVAAARVAYTLARFFWLLALVEDHTVKRAAETCHSDLTVPVILGFAIEFAATATFRLVNDYGPHYVEKWHQYVASATSGVVTVMGIYFTGIYANPIAASALLWDCKGVSRTGHLIVYWLAPMLSWSMIEYWHELPSFERINDYVPQVKLFKRTNQPKSKSKKQERRDEKRKLKSK